MFITDNANATLLSSLFDLFLGVVVGANDGTENKDTLQTWIEKFKRDNPSIQMIEVPDEVTLYLHYIIGTKNGDERIQIMPRIETLEACVCFYNQINYDHAFTNEDGLLEILDKIIKGDISSTRKAQRVYFP